MRHGNGLKLYARENETEWKSKKFWCTPVKRNGIIYHVFINKSFVSQNLFDSQKLVERKKYA